MFLPSDTTQLLTNKKLSYAQELVAPLALGFIKASYFILFFQIFKPVPNVRVAIWLGGVLCTVFYILVFVLNTYFATPRPGETFITHYLNPVNRNGEQLAVPMSAIGLVFDLYIISLPVYGVWQLQLSTQKKNQNQLSVLDWSIVSIYLSSSHSVPHYSTMISACVSAMLTLNYRVKLQNTNDFLKIVYPMSITT